MRASSKRPRVESSSGVAPLPPSSTSDTSAKAPTDPTAAAIAVPPPFTLDDSSIRRMLGTVMIVQAAHGQLLVDMLDKLRSLQVNLKTTSCMSTSCS